VWRSENGGESWNRLAHRLPKKQSYFTVLRDAMDIDRLKTPAVYIYPPIGQTVDDGHDFLHLGGKHLGARRVRLFGRKHAEVSLAGKSGRLSGRDPRSSITTRLA
jgi:hypothetical protein